MSEVIDETLLSALGDFDVDDVDDNLPPPNRSYVADILSNSSLRILQSGRVKKAFSESKELGLFRLFITRQWFEAMRSWVNEKLTIKGISTINENKFKAYIGLELATSLVSVNDLKDYWCKEMFSGQVDFKTTMGRDEFLEIRRNIVLCHPNSYDHVVASNDPIWHSRKMLEHIQKNCATIAVPLGSSALDEAGFRTKARTNASSYIPNKPDKYAVRMYAVVGTKHAYCSAMVNNGSGNTTSISQVEDYCRIHRELRTPCNKTFDDKSEIDKDSPSALWVLMMAHQTKTLPDPSGKRIFFSDNFYTRHILASSLKKITDGEARLIGTVKFTNVDATNRKYLSNAIVEMKDAERGAWKLVRAYNKVPDLAKLQRAHNARNKKLPAKDRKVFVSPCNLVAENAGYIVWKDKKVVIFYSNDLAGTPSDHILDGSSDEAIKCVHGLLPIKRWTGVESFHRTIFMVPAAIVAYNLFMNSVDRMDQMMSTVCTRRKEKRLHMSFFTYLMDFACVQAYAVYHHVQEKGVNMTLEKFKRNICIALVRPHRLKRNYAALEEVESRIAVNADIVVGTNSNVHMLIENLEKKDIQCHFCYLRGKSSRSIYGCVACKKGFHVNCFTAFHCQGALAGNSRALVDTIVSTNSNNSRANKQSKCVGTIEDLRL